VANPDAERKFEANGKTYTLFFGNRSFRMLEQKLGKSFQEFNFNSVDEMTVALWSGLQKYHPDISVDDMDDIIDDVGYVKLAGIAAEAINGAFPEADEETPQGNANRAQRRAQDKVGTGTTT
jgi:hypothetical protein